VTGYVFNNQVDRKEYYTPAGKLTKIEFNAGGFVVFAYDPATGNLLSATDHFGRTLTFGYNTLNKLVQVTAPGGAVYAYTYDTGDLLLTRVAPGSQTLTYNYDYPSYNRSHQHGC